MARRINTPFLLVVLGTIAVAVVVIGGLIYIKTKNDPLRHIRHGDDLMTQGLHEEAHGSYMRAIGKDPFMPKYYDKAIEALLLVVPETQEDANNRFGTYMALLFKKAEVVPSDEASEPLRLAIEANRVVLEGVESERGGRVVSRFEGMSNELATYEDLPESDADRAWMQCHLLEHEWRFSTLLTEGEWNEALARLDALVELDPRSQFNQYVRLRARLDRAMGDMAGARKRAAERELTKIAASLTEARAAAGNAPEFDLIEFDAAHRQYVSGRSTDIPDLTLLQRIVDNAEIVSERRRITELAAQLQLLGREQLLTAERDYVLDALAELKRVRGELAERLYELDPEDWRNVLQYISSRDLGDLDVAMKLAQDLANAPMPTVGPNARRHAITQLQAAAFVFRAVYAKVTTLRSSIREEADDSTALEAELAAELEELDASYEGLMAIMASGSIANPELHLQLELDLAYAHEEWDRALESVNKLVAAGARFDSAKMLVAADVAMRAGDVGAAATFIDDVIARRPDLQGDASFALIRARLAFQSGNFERAAQLASGVIASLEGEGAGNDEVLANARAILRNAHRRGQPGRLQDDPLTEVYADASRAMASGDIDRYRTILATALATYEAMNHANDQERADAERAVQRLLTSLTFVEVTELDGDIETAKTYAARLLAINPENRVGLLISSVKSKDRVAGLRAVAEMAEPDDEERRKVRFWMSLRNELAGLIQSLEAAAFDPGLYTAAERADLEENRVQVEAEADRLEAEVLAAETKSTTVLRYLFGVAIKDNDLETARATMAELIAQEGESWRTEIARARLHSAGGDLKAAAESLAAAIEAGRSNAIVWRVYGRSLLELGQVEAGTQALATASANAPGDAGIALDYSTALFRGGKSAEALHVLRQASAVGRSNRLFRARWLALEEQIGSSSTALFELKRTWEINPGNWQNAVAYGKLLVSADADWRDVRDPQTGRQLINAAKWARLPRVEKMRFVDTVRFSRIKTSEQVFSELVRRPNASPAVFIAYADTLEMRGERERGLELLKTTLVDTANTLGAFERAILCIDLANRYLEVANYDEANQWIDRARATQPEGDPIADRMLVGLWQTKADARKLAASLRRVLELDRSDGAEQRKVPQLRLLIRALLDSGEAAEALAVFDGALGDSTLAPDLLLAGALHLERSRVGLIEGDNDAAATAFEEAKKLFETAAESAPGSLEPWMQLARLFELRHQWGRDPADIEVAITHAREAQRRFGSSWIAQELLALLLIRAEQLEAASGGLEDYLKGNQMNDDARVMLVRMYESMGRLERSVELCQEAVDRNPFDIPWNVRLGKLRGDQGRYSEASVSFKRLFDITRDPSVARFYVEMRLLRDPPDYEGVLAFARANVEMFREDPFLAGSYAATMAHGGRVQSAFNEMESAYKRFEASGASPGAMQQLVTWLPRIIEVTNPEANVAEQSEQLLSTMTNGTLDLGSRVVLAQEWIKSGADGYSRAMEHLRVVTAPGDLAGAFGASPYLSLGSLLYGAGDCIGSLDMFEKALAMAPGSALLMNNVAFARAQCDNDLDQAAKEATEASRLEPLNANILDTLGFIKIKQGDYAAAGTALRRSLARKRTVAAMLHLAEVKIALKKWDEAETLLKEAGDAKPSATQQKDLSQLVADLAAKKGNP